MRLEHLAALHCEPPGLSRRDKPAGSLVHRRGFIAAGIGALCATTGLSGSEVPRSRLGMVIHTYSIRSGAKTAGAAEFGEPLNFLEHCRQLGAGGIQVSIAGRDGEYARRLRRAAESAGMFVEASIRLPRDKADAERFTAEVRAAVEAGVSVLRTVALSGRRYEVFSTAGEFEEFALRARESVSRAEPVVRRHNMRLAVENHKDWRIGEHLDLIRKMSSEHVGICVDTGNSIALLEDPYRVVEECAKWAFSVHIKDMAVQEYEQGFLLAEVPLGTGILDLKRMIATLRGARPEVRFSLEMITRDPLKIPCLTDKYWATFGGVPGSDLARTLDFVRRHAATKPLAKISTLPLADRLALEEENNRKCLAYAREHLAL
jgi:sugar phosphate isomerase/epimerase